MDILHHQIGPLPLFFHGIDRDHVGIVDPRRGLGLAEKSPMCLGTCGQLRRKNLDRHGAMEDTVECLEHDAHRSPPKYAENLILSELADGRRVFRRLEEFKIG